VPPRTEGQQRRYDPEAARRLNFIRHSRELGFEIDDIRELLSLSAQPKRPCENADKITARHLDAVDLRIKQLTALRKELKKMLDDCHGGCVAECRVIDSLSAPSISAWAVNKPGPLRSFPERPSKEGGPTLGVANL
jgi:hypothetical protein